MVDFKQLAEQYKEELLDRVLPFWLEHSQDASSLINAVNTVFGSLGMMLGALNWSNFIEGLGIITAVCVTLAIAGWLALLHFKIKVEGL